MLVLITYDVSTEDAAGRKRFDQLLRLVDDAEIAEPIRIDVFAEAVGSYTCFHWKNLLLNIVFSRSVRYLHYTVFPRGFQ